MILSTNRVSKAVFVFVLSVFVSTVVIAQTPADDPGIGGPGIGAAPAGDGSPIVPFDGGMSLLLAASGMGYVVKRMKLSIKN